MLLDGAERCLLGEHSRWHKSIRHKHRTHAGRAGSLGRAFPTTALRRAVRGKFESEIVGIELEERKAEYSHATSIRSDTTLRPLQNCTRPSAGRPPSRTENRLGPQQWRRRVVVVEPSLPNLRAEAMARLVFIWVGAVEQECSASAQCPPVIKRLDTCRLGKEGLSHLGPCRDQRSLARRFRRRVARTRLPLDIVNVEGGASPWSPDCRHRGGVGNALVSFHDPRRSQARNGGTLCIGGGQGDRTHFAILERDGPPP